MDPVGRGPTAVDGAAPLAPDGPAVGDPPGSTLTVRRQGVTGQTRAGRRQLQ